MPDISTTTAKPRRRRLKMTKAAKRRRARERARREGRMADAIDRQLARAAARSFYIDD